MLLRSRLAHRSVPLARRQLLAEPAKLAVALAAVAAAVALVLMLAGLRRGMGEQVTVYVDRQAPVLVGQAGTRNFVSHASVLPEEVGARIAVVRGTASAVPISQQYAMLHLHGRRVVSLLIGSDPGAPGGPWRLASGRAPGGPGELALDRVLASEHGLRVGNTVSYRGASLRIVGLSSGTSGFMTPLVFATRETVNALGRRPATASFFLVSPAAGTSPAALAARIEQAVPGITATVRGDFAESEGRVAGDMATDIVRGRIVVGFVIGVAVAALVAYGSTLAQLRD